MKTYSILILFFLAMISQGSSCKSGGKCEEPYNVIQSSVQVIFKDKLTGNYLYTEFNPIYNKDSIKIFDGPQQLYLLYSLNLMPGSIQKYWEVNFGEIYNPSNDAGSFNAEKCKDFIIKYNYHETDTIKTCFKAKKTPCGSVFETLKVYYKGEMIGSVSNTTAALVVVMK